ncbi:MAG: serine hydrolase domain-containing protein [Bacteroidales bacterium]
MKTLHVLLVMGVLVLGTSCHKDGMNYYTDNDLIRDELESNVVQHLRKIKSVNPDFPGGFALQVTYPGGQAFVSAGLGHEATNNIHFRAASNTKTLTSAAILLLMQRGQIDINQRITDTMPGSRKTYLPDTPDFDIPFKKKITILQLLQHRAGVFDVSNFVVPDSISVDVPYKGQSYIEYVMGKNPDHTFTFDEMIGVNATCGLYDFKPGKDYHYSNTGYSILGKIIERVSGKTYGRFINDEILVPMGMRSSSMPDAGNDQQLPQSFAPGFVQLEDQIENVTESNISANVAEGNLITTPIDLARFLRKLIRGEGILNSTTVNSIMLNVLPSSSTSNSNYGCGIFYTNNLGYGHNGAHEGYLSQMAYDPDSDITLVVFTNTWDWTAGMTTLISQLKGMQDLLYQAKLTVTDNLNK